MSRTWLVTALTVAMSSVWLSAAQATQDFCGLLPHWPHC